MNEHTIDIAALLRHRDELKRRDPEVIFLFRVESNMGDRYRAYGDDARRLEHTTIEAYVGCDVHKAGLPDGWCDIHPTSLAPVLARIAAAGKRAEVVERVAQGDAPNFFIQEGPEGLTWGQIRPAKVAAEAERVATEGAAALEKLNAIEEAIRDYYLALDNREHGDIASGRAFDRIQNVLGMFWRQGDEKRRREAIQEEM